MGFVERSLKISFAGLFAFGLAAHSHAAKAASDLTQERVQLQSKAVVVTHATRFYHTGAETIRQTNELVAAALDEGRRVYALAQKPLGENPDWYTAKNHPDLFEIPSRAGGHHLFPQAQVGSVFRVTAMGGYHCACLGWTLSELVARFIQHTPGRQLALTLPMAAIYTGYRFTESGKRVPRDPEDEAKADSSVDGLNLHRVTRGMDDETWVAFMRESLYWAVFYNAPMRIDLSGVEFQLARDGRVVDIFQRADDVGRGRATEKIVRFDYRSPGTLERK